jgi:hypothetical protein
MADTKHQAGAGTAPAGPTEGDGISYSGLAWFMVILTATTLVCAGLMVWLMDFEAKRVRALDTPAAPHAATVAPNQVPPSPPPPNLIPLDSRTMPLGEPTYLQRFREAEEAELTTYGWIDRNAGTLRIPIDRAKARLLERGLPTRAKTP